jgi:hypothetical protein
LSIIGGSIREESLLEESAERKDSLPDESAGKFGTGVGGCE